MRFLNADDGARVLFDFVDRELGMNCYFCPTPNGTFRCLPHTPIDCAPVCFGACGSSIAATHPLEAFAELSLTEW